MLNYIPSTSERFQATNKSNPCPLCGNTSGHDSFSGEGVLCHNGLDGALAGNGWRFVKNTKDDQWGIYYPDGQEYDREKTERYRQQRISQERKRLQKALPIKDRDKYYRQLAATPSERAIADLLHRGLTREQIEKYHFFDIRGGQFVPVMVPDNFPSVKKDYKFSNGGKVFSYAVEDAENWKDLEGYTIPCYTLDGQISGYQISNTQGLEPKYKWATNSKLPLGEMPLTVFLAAEQSKDLWGCDGVLKALIASEKHRINIIGAFGGNYEACQSQVKEVVSNLKPDRFIQAVDGGDLSNPSVLKRFEREYRFLSQLGLEVIYAWWGQREKKTHPDIDELLTLEGIQYLSCSELSKLAPNFNPDRLEPLEPDTAAYQEYLDWEKEQEANEKAYQEYLEEEKRKNHEIKVLNAQRKLNNFTYPVNLELNVKYLPDFGELAEQGIIPQKGILIVKSYKGSGKSSRLIKPLIEHYKTLGKNIISIVPRIALGRAQSTEWGIEWIEDAKVSEIDTSLYRENCQTIGLCWDSLGKIYSRDWGDGVVILDECEQGLSHLVTSSTLKDKRSFVLKTFEEKIRECLSNNSLVILSDADLTDISVDYIKSLAPDNTPIFSLVNNYLPPSWNLEFNTGKKDCVIDDLFQQVENGLKAIVATDSQREAESLDRNLSDKFPDQKIIRIDGKTCSEDFGKNFVEKINKSIDEEKPDVLIYTSSMGNGVSITNKYFDVNFCFFFGVLEPSQARQMLARERSQIPRIVWCDDFRVPSGCPSFIPETIKNSLHRYNEDSLKISDLLEIDSSNPDDEEQSNEEHLKIEEFYRDLREKKGNWNNPHLDLYAKFKARYNYGVSNLSLLLRQQLIEEGHNIIDYGSDEVTNLGTKVKETKEEIKKEEATNISNAEDIDIERAKKLNCRVTKTEQERHQITKAFLKEELPEIELTPSFVYKAVTKDNRRYLNAIKLFWYSQNPEKTKAINKKYLKGKITNQKGVTLLSDFRTFSPKAKLINDLELFKRIDLSDPEKEYSGKDQAVIELRDRAYFFRHKIYQSFGLTVTPKTDPIKLIERLLERLGLDLESAGQRRIEGERVRFYRLDSKRLLDPDRLSVLAALDKKYSEVLPEKGLGVSQDSQKIIYIRESCDSKSDGLLSTQEELVHSKYISIVKPSDDANRTFQVSQDSQKIIYINESPVTARPIAASSLEPEPHPQKEEKNHDIIQDEIQEPNMLNPNPLDAKSNLISINLENGTLFSVGDIVLTPDRKSEAKIIKIESGERIKLDGFDHLFSAYLIAHKNADSLNIAKRA